MPTKVTDALLFILIALAVVVVVLQVLILRRASEVDEAPHDPARDAAVAADLARRVAEAIEPGSDRRTAMLREELSRGREEQGRAAELLRAATAEHAAQSRGEAGRAMAEQRRELLEALQRLATSLDAQLGSIRTLTQQKLDETRALTETKLSEMRGVVEEKLQKALEERVGAAFRGVGERLEEVQRGLGEMRSLVGEVGDLKRVLTNVKARGTWGEAQLASILEDFLAPDQYEANAAIRGESNERVEFAVRFPGGPDEEPVLLPIDSKFPREDYERLLVARERADAEAATSAGLALERAIRDSAQEISRKYIHPPRTVPFAILFVPTEGLYAELMQRPGVVDELQRMHSVTVAGPTTLAAMLMSFRVGFRTLAIQKRSDEVWRVLARAKSEFNKFGEVIEAVQKHLERAQNQLSQTGTRTRQIERALRSVETIPEVDAPPLPAPGSADGERALRLDDLDDDADPPPASKVRDDARE